LQSPASRAREGRACAANKQLPGLLRPGRRGEQGRSDDPGEHAPAGEAAIAVGDIEIDPAAFTARKGGVGGEIQVRRDMAIGSQFRLILPLPEPGSVNKP